MTRVPPDSSPTRRTALLTCALAAFWHSSSTFAQAPAVQPASSAQSAAPASDEALTQAVHAALEADPNYYFRHVDVRVEKGIATLSGYIDSGAAISRARKVAAKVPGVTRVVTSNLKVDTQLRR
ncbi:MAG TPA: BON domain-containing protein [Steroidobacteraceae bacterium]|nr:BON domain-containing protein [Steroidobacteraceae bacterium]